MKRIISAMLCFVMLCSVGFSTAYASSEDYTGTEIELESTSSETAVFNEENQVVDWDSDLVMLTASSNEIAPSDIDSSIVMDIDLSNALNVTEKFLGRPTMLDTIGIESPVDSADLTVPAALPPNNPPVDNSEWLIYNPESMKDGQFTTDSIFMLVTRYNNVDLCYDPDGTSVRFQPNDDFPKGYYGKMTSDDGSLVAYVFHFFNAGSYLLEYAFEDDYGGMSEKIYMLFEIAPRGEFEVIDGELNSVTDTDRFEITVDYSVADEYCFGLLRTGTGGAVVTAYYSDGVTEVGSISTEGPAFGQAVSRSKALPCPDGVTGEYTYILKVSTYESRYVEGDTKYRIAYGASSQKYFFFEGAANCMDLPYHTTSANYKSVSPAYNAWAATSEIGHYYKITATGSEVVTLNSSYGQYSFKVLDCDTLQTLYDGINLPRTNYEMYTPSYTSSVKLGFEAGKSYYIVVYDSNETDHRGCYCIMVGERHIVLGEVVVELNSATVSANRPATWTYELKIPTKYNAYIHNVYYQPKAIGAPTFTMLTPGSRSWTLLTLAGFKSGYDQGAAPIQANGEWQFKATSSTTTTFPGATVRIYYWFEV